MQVKTVYSSDVLTRHRERLRDAAGKERARAQELSQSGSDQLALAEEKKNAAADNFKKGEELKNESDRLRRNGREQSLRGLTRLADGSDRYAESFEKQETGLTDLQGSLGSMGEANTAKTGGLNKIDQGLTEQESQNAAQSGTVSELEASHNQSRSLSAQKSQHAEGLQQNLGARSEELNTQAERIGDFLLAGADFDQGSALKSDGFQDLKGATGHRVQAEAYNDVKAEAELKQSWSEGDADRHQKAERRLFFDSLFESLRAQASSANASLHHQAAERGEMRAEDLQHLADGLKVRAEGCLQNARTLECSGQHHLMVGQQMKMCPWTYCQGMALEQQGYAELARAQEMKSHARSLREEAQAKALEAETSRVRAEQAREVGDEYEIQGHGSSLRSNLLKERSEAHEQSAEKAEASAQNSQARAERMARAAQSESEQARSLNRQGHQKLQQGFSEQRSALGTQGRAAVGFERSLSSEGELQNGAEDYLARVSENLTTGRSVLGRNRNLLEQLRGSVHNEQSSQQKVQEGIDEFKTGGTQSAEATQQGRQAAQILEEARSLELEGLRLQTRGQKMLLQARPKMADAARLSAESFDAYKKGGTQEEEAERLIAEGTQKLAAAEILKQKATAYENIANK
ncbi:MAG: hypothetical protein WC314_21755 [Vulcanimicrobiota bacterium]